MCSVFTRRYHHPCRLPVGHWQPLLLLASDVPSMGPMKPHRNQAHMKKPEAQEANPRHNYRMDSKLKQLNTIGCLPLVGPAWIHER